MENTCLVDGGDIAAPSVGWGEGFSADLALSWGRHLVCGENLTRRVFSNILGLDN